MFDPLALWKALRHFSLTFAIIFASTLLGASVTSLLKKILGTLPLPWLVLWLAPMILVAIVAKREAQWLPDPELRRRIARRIVGVSIVIWIVMMVVRFAIAPDEPESADPAPASSAPTRPVHRGPPAK